MKTQETAHNSKQNSFRIITSLMLIALLGIASVSLGASDTWTQKADMPTRRLGLATSVVNGKIYANGDMSSPQLTNPSQYVLMPMNLWRRLVMTLDIKPPFW